MSSNALQPYYAVRENAGFWERADVGLLAVRGEDRYAWLQGMVSNDTQRLATGEVSRLPACLLNATGHLIADLTLLNIPDDDPHILMELPRLQLEKVTALLDRYIIMEDVELENVSATRRVLTVQGPLSPVLRATFPADHTGSGGYDAYVPFDDFGLLCERLRRDGVTEIDANTAELLRIEAGIPKYGADMDESVIALEAGLGPTHISFTKGCYVGQEIIARIDSRGHTNRALTGFIVEGGDLPVSGDKLFGTAEDGGERETGRITSVIESSPAADGRPIALGYARHEHRAAGTILNARNEGRETTLRVVELPFYRRLSAP